MNKDVEDMQKAGCTWPECECSVPYYAFSAHNRTAYCQKLKTRRALEELGKLDGDLL